MGGPVPVGCHERRGWCLEAGTVHGWVEPGCGQIEGHRPDRGEMEMGN